MNAQTIRRSILPMLGAGALLLASTPSAHATEHFEKHFPVKGHPVVCIHNIGDGRIEVKSSKNQEVIVAGTTASKKVALETEAPGDRIDVSPVVIDAGAQPGELEVNFQLTVPEETALEL